MILKAPGPMPFADVETAVDGTKGSIRFALQQLVKDGQVLADGATNRRRYVKVAQAEFHTERRTKQEAGKARNAAKVADGIDRVVFRDQVAKAIAGDPGCLNEQRIAQALRADVDDVTEACAWLLERHQITRGDDGRYTRNASRRARLRAAA